MKKILLIIAILLLSISFVSAQITIKPNFGLGLGTGNQSLDQDEVISAAGLTTKKANIYENSAAGLILGLGIEAELAKGLAAGLNFGYNMGSEVTISKKVSGTPITTDESKFQVSYMPLDILLKVSTTLDKLTPYASFGPTVILSPKGILKKSTIGTGVDNQEETEFEFTSGLGFTATLGADYAVSDMISIGLGVTLRQVALKTSKSKITKQTANGVDTLAGQTVQNTEVEYKDDTAGVIASPTTPTVRNVRVMSFDMIVISLGVGFKF